MLSCTGLYCCPVTVFAYVLYGTDFRMHGLLAPAFMAHNPLVHSKEKPSVTFSLRRWLQAKTIKANRVQMFEPALPTLPCLTHSYPASILLFNDLSILGHKLSQPTPGLYPIWKITSVPLLISALTVNVKQLCRLLFHVALK